MTGSALNRKAFEQHPVLAELDDLAYRLTGTNMVIVYPRASGWGEAHPGHHPEQPAFCNLIQSAPQGAKQCRMCHVLMTVAACSAGMTDQQCHAGARVLITPATHGEDEAFAVLSSCLFSSESDESSWDETRMRGEQLGLSASRLKNASQALPRLRLEQREHLKSIMSIAAGIVREIRHRHALELQMDALTASRKPPTPIREELEKSLSHLDWSPLETGDAGGEGGRMPLLIRVLEQLVRQRPDLPFSVSEIAAAARVTPNHFSSVFRKHTGECFSKFLARERLHAAKCLLQDVTLSISEVAIRSGYDDPGYFARRFRKETGRSPGEWRDSLAPAPEA